jgi:shikimate 5-dehydrogenase
MVRSITKDTVVCMSLAGRPSNIGTRFHNFLYAELGLDFVYKAFTTTTTTDLAAPSLGSGPRAFAAAGSPCPTRRPASSSWTPWTARPR